MNKYSYILSIWLFALLLAFPSRAQYSTANIDGNISNGEYGANDGGNWYVTWDANNLYVAKKGGAPNEPAIMYLDLDPTLPVTGGGFELGNVTGNNDYNVTPRLPFRADVRVYFTNTYIEIRRRDSKGNWGTQTQVGLSLQTASVREISLSWNALTGGSTIPPSFNWLGFAINDQGENNNYRYDLAPSNPKAAGNNNTSPPFEFYNTVASTASGSATNPFLLKSYTFLNTNDFDNTSNTADNNDFRDIIVWDFTMNQPGRQISRSKSGGNWMISGSLVVGGGSLFFGNDRTANFGDTDLGNVRVMGNGILSLNQTTKTVIVHEDIDLTGGGQFILSGVEGSDLRVGRNFRVTNGLTSPATLQTNTRAIIFQPTPGTTALPTSHTISANSDYVIPFTYLTLNTPNPVTLGSSIAVGNSLAFVKGNLYTGSNYVLLDGGSALSSLASETEASHVVGNTRITQVLGTAGSGTKEFGNVGFVLSPQNNAARGETTITRVTGTSILYVGGGSYGSSIKRYFVVTGGTSTALLNLFMQLTYRTDELNGIPVSNLALYQSDTGAPGTFTKLTPITTNGNTINYNYSGVLTSGTYFTLSDGTTPLPVTLVSFTAAPTAQGGALLRWVTANEANSKGFGIERQLGSSATWQPVGYVASTNHASGSTYEYADKSLASAPSTTQAYYRLRQEDNDGTVSYSPVAVITRTAGVVGTDLALSPVPVSGPSLSLSFAEVSQGGSEVVVTNVQGQQVLRLITSASTDEALSLPVDKLASGVYIVSVRVPGQAQRHARFVKQ